MAKSGFIEEVTFKGEDIQNFWEGRITLYGGLTILLGAGDLITPEKPRDDLIYFSNVQLRKVFA